MKNWLAWLQQLLHKNNIPNWLVVTGFVVALVGFADASYLTFEKLSGHTPPCVITQGCDVVTTSKYSYFGPIPVALAGAIFYLVLLVLFFITIDIKDKRYAVLALKLTPFGFLFSLYFLFIQAFVLNAYCIYCLGSLATSSTLFGLAAYAKIKKLI